MIETYGAVTAITVRWSVVEELGRVPPLQRAKIIAALKAGDILVMDLVTDAIHELTKIYEEGGYTLTAR